MFYTMHISILLDLHFSGHSVAFFYFCCPCNIFSIFKCRKRHTRIKKLRVVARANPKAEYYPDPRKQKLST